ncbi:ABC transporter ATP-binding protein [Cephaloticoccus capnophilus]|uniref:ABC transporter ATP-binding protein n=1 Tax=Cephaloticoccus capnophilus TaxID=1548208 RepID=UPI0009EDA303|nr:ABC transporter ATP-binding protein [Cephaloticoccus capnophilus]
MPKRLATKPKQQKKPTTTGLLKKPVRPALPHQVKSPKAAAPILNVSDLHIRRGKTVILERVDWRINRGENWVILGANGSGKTSLLRALTGYFPPTRGEIELLGGQYGNCDWRALREHIGIVTTSFTSLIPPAEPALETVISGKFAQLDLWKKVTKVDCSAARKLLALVDGSYLETREWQFLSQGERQRVLIARALMARPRLLILDEPCAGLDPVARVEFLKLVDRLARSPRAPALVFVTHHVEEITPAFTHALLLRKGGVVAAGTRARTLNSEKLSQVFAAPVRLSRSATHGLRLDIQSQ